MDLRIVATESVPPAAGAAFAGLGSITLDDGEIPNLLSNAQVLIVRTRRVDQPLLERMPYLRVIARTGVGLDRIDLKEATRRGIPVVYAPEAATVPIAEGTLALLFAATKQMLQLHAVVVEGRWEHRYDHDIRDLAGATLGVVGLGRIGSEVARMAAALGMDVIGFDPWAAAPGRQSEIAIVERVGLEDLFGRSDIVTLHCELNASSRGMISRSLLAKAKPGLILINASRGGLLTDDDVLLEALEHGWLSAVGLDVFAQEPPDPESPLLRDRRVVTSPHAIGLTRAWNQRVFESLATDVRRLFDGSPPHFVANPEAVSSKWSPAGESAR